MVKNRAFLMAAIYYNRNVGCFEINLNHAYKTSHKK
jgi:hypothetical protein